MINYKKLIVSTSFQFAPGRLFARFLSLLIQQVKMWFSRCQQSADCPFPVGKNAPEMKPDQGPGELAYRPEGQAVEHAVLDFRSPVNRRESMGVMPEIVGTLDLLVDESVGGIPVRYQRTPVKGNAPKSEAIVDHSACADFERRWRD